MSVNDLRNIAVPFRRQRTTILNRATTPKQASMHLVRQPSKPGGSSAAMQFVFPFTPQQIQYSNMSPELSEIMRPGKMPIIAFNRHRARQITFKFLLAKPLDGLFTSVDASIAYIQQMALEARPVYFTNMDKQISNPLSAFSGNSRIFWSITDFTISSIRRNEENQIVAAEANLTLVENVNPRIRVADLPVIKYTSQVPQQNKPSSNTNKDVDFSGGSWTKTRPSLTGGTSVGVGVP